MNRPEHHLHIATVQALRLGLPAGWIPQHSFAQGLRSPRDAALAKAYGQVAGWPDLAVWGQDEVGRPATWFIELKAVKGRLSADQHACHDRLRDLGHGLIVARSLNEVLDQGRAWGWPLSVRA